MNRFYKRINRYLMAIVCVLLIAFLGISFYWVGGGQTTQKVYADETWSEESWLGHFDSNINLSGGSVTSVRISTPAEWAWACLALNQVNDPTNAETFFANTTFYLTSREYDFGQYYWTPMGTNIAPFKGKFVIDENLGVNKVVIKNLRINNTNDYYARSLDAFGLFGVVDNCTNTGQGYIEGIEIQNLMMDIDTSLAPGGTVYVGGIAGKYAGQKKSGANDASISDCVVSGTINVDSENPTSTKTVHIGGIVGHLATKSKISFVNGGTSSLNIYPGASTSANYSVGGLVGTNEGTVAGIASSATEQTETKLVLQSRIIGSVGNCGLAVGQNMTSGVVDKIIVGATSGSSALLQYEGLNTMYGGGLVGVNNGNINECASYASINTYNQTFGGIVGQNKGTVTKSAFGGRIIVDVNVARDNNAIDINSDGGMPKIKGSLYLGGICGENNNASTISQCTSNGKIEGYDMSGVSGGVVGGIAGSNKGSIYNSVNNANLGENMAIDYLGGITGENLGKITSDTTGASVEPNKFTANNGTLYGYLFVGGIAGILGSSSGASTNNYEISTSYNLGDVYGVNTATTTVGGIVGCVRNCGTDTKIESCFNKGTVGSTDSTSIAGGVVGKIIIAKFTLSNTANYGDVYANLIAGGMVGSLEAMAILPEFSKCIATGKVVSNTVSGTGGMGGLIGVSNTDSVVSALTSCAFDLGVAGYGLTIGGTLGYAPDRVSKFRVVGNVGVFSLTNSVLTYYMTMPGAATTDLYAVANLRADTANWHFASTEIISTQGFYYYPVQKVFADASIFGTMMQSTGFVTRMPSQTLTKVTLKNYLPDYWDTDADGIAYRTTSINIYPELVFDSILTNLVDTGQYVIVGQKIARPTPKDNPYDYDEYKENDMLDDYYRAQDEDGLRGIYWRHAGFDPSFVLNSPFVSEPFDFGEITTETDIFIAWKPKQFSISYRIYDYDTNTYVTPDSLEDATLTITYNMRPGSTQEVAKFKQTGRTFWGWRTNGDLIRTNYATEDEWCEAWASSSTIIASDQVYADGLTLYGMYSALKITLTLHAGEAQGVDAIYPDRSNSTQYMTAVEFGQTYQLDIPTIAVAGYEFRGYYSAPTGGVICVDMSGQFVSNLTENTEFFGRWVYTIQEVHYVTMRDGMEVELRVVSAHFNDYISTDDIFSQQTAIAWGIDYTMVDPSVDANGYTFAGCYVDPYYETEFDFYSMKILEETRIYVKWDLLDFALTLNANIGLDPSGNLRAGGWGPESKDKIILRVPYNTNLLDYLRNWQLNDAVQNSVQVVGFTAHTLYDGSYIWSKQAIEMGADYDTNASYLMTLNNNNYWMPANDNLELFIIWKRNVGSLKLDANGGAFLDSSGNVVSTVRSFDLWFELNVSSALNELNIVEPKKQGFAFKYWSLAPNGGPLSNTMLMPMDCTLYAVYGEQRTVTFYVIGAYPENVVGQMVVFDGATLGEGSTLEEINRKIGSFLKGEDDAESAFELDYWVEMTFDTGYNITESTERFDFETRIINADINLLAKLKPNENYVAPNKDTTNYILIAGAVMLVALILLFIVIVSRPSKKKLTVDNKSKNKDIQAKLDEIKELERRRHDLDKPFD